jgi:subtilase family serine protease
MMAASRMRRSAALLGVVVALSLAACAPAANTSELPASAPASPAAVTEPVELGPTAADEPIELAISLRLPGAADLDAYLAGLSDPAAPNYHRYLTPDEFGARFGLPSAEIDRVAGWLAAGGLTVTRYPQRTSLAASGSARDVENLLGVRFVDRLAPTGERYHAAIGEPAVPPALAADIAAILGLDSEPVVHMGLGGIYASGIQPGGMLPDTVARAYEIDALHAAGLNGEGQTIAIVSLDTYTPSDIDLFDRHNGISGPAVEEVRLAGALDTPGDQTAEVALDIEVLRDIAPQAKIISYEGPNQLGWVGPIIARIVADGQARLVSVSWGRCERHYARSAADSDQQELAAAYAAGLTVLVASGDNGAYDCRRLQPSDGSNSRDLSAGVEWPGSSPSVIAVGGTYLSIRQDGTYLTEAGWEDPLSGLGAGGGVSTFWQRPAWQVGTGVDNADSNGMRQLPDVAGPADPQSGFSIIYTDPTQGRVAAQFGGTSAAAPFFAASLALTEQLAQREGVAVNVPLGPVLYQVAAEQPAGAVFHDVVRGGNLLEDAGPGWDYVTGLGTPRVTPLARAIVDFLAR